MNLDQQTSVFDAISLFSYDYVDYEWGGSCSGNSKESICLLEQDTKQCVRIICMYLVDGDSNMLTLSSVISDSLSDKVPYSFVRNNP
jgi:hypothetical protein